MHSMLLLATRHGSTALRPMAHDPSSPPKNWYQNHVPETWVQVLHTRHTRNWYQKASDASQKAGSSFQSYANDELAIAPAIFTAIYVTEVKENKRKRTLAGE